MDSKDYYQILGVGEDATPQQIKQAYRDEAIKHHPDRNPSHPDALERIQAINEAYAVLSDPQKRIDYDALKEKHGPSAYNHFRGNYTEQDIFEGSDIAQVLEEMARSLGIRGFDEVFRELEGQGFRRFETKRPGLHVKGFFFAGRIGGRKPLLGVARNLHRLLSGRLGRKQLPLDGEDIHDTIELRPYHAQEGGPYAYYHRKRNKKLVVKVPQNTRNGQRIRLAGMGEEGRAGGAPGDLLLKVKINRPALEKVRRYLDSLTGR